MIRGRKPGPTARLLFLVPLLLLFFDFLWPVMTLQKSFIGSDYSVQHWPWARYLYDELRAGRCPFWTDAMACGFPLVAEGQIAAFYGPHRILFALLPFWPAYSWSIVLHFLAGSLGFYAYARAARLSRAGAGFSAAIYAFGSGFAGCFYNTGSLRTLAWFPLLLWLVEKMPGETRARRARLAVIAALAVGQMWNAGFAQIAVYAFGYVFVMALFGLRRRNGVESLAWYGTAVVAGTALAAPQIALSWELIGESVRRGESAAFALWGSMPPSGPVSLLFPEWGNIQRVSFYAGVPAVFMAAAFAFLPRGRKDWRHACLFLLFAAAALGKFNPLYAALVKGLSLNFFRVPSKFLFFAVAAFALLAGQGLDAFLLAIKRGAARRLFFPAAGIAAFAAALPGACRLAWLAAGPMWGKFSGRVVSSVLAEKGAVARPAAEYSKYMEDYYGRLGELFSYAQAHTLASVVLSAACAAVLILAMHRKIGRPVFLVLFFALAVADFHFYGRKLGTGFIGNAEKLASAAPDARIRFLQKAAVSDPGAIAEFDVDPSDEFLPPNRTMAYGLSHAGGYSPLLLKNYYELVYDLGIVDGSLGRAPFSEKVWQESRGLLDLAGIQCLASDAKLPWAGFDEIGREGNAFFYRNARVLPVAAAWTKAKVIPESSERLRYLKSSEYDPRSAAVVDRDLGLPSGGEAVFSIAEIEQQAPGKLKALYALPGEGVGWARVAAYPGWRLRIDGKPQPWFRVNHAFIGFRLEAGAHEVELDYVPSRYREALLVSAAAGLLALAACLSFFKPKPV